MFLQAAPETAFSIMDVVLWLKVAVEAAGAAAVGLGLVTALYQFARAKFVLGRRNFNEIRLTLARFLSLALEFQLGADILATTFAPSWQQIGQLGVVAIIRTALNYFLRVEMREEQMENAALPVENGGMFSDDDKTD